MTDREIIKGIFRNCIFLLKNNNYKLTEAEIRRINKTTSDIIGGKVLIMDDEMLTIYIKDNDVMHSKEHDRNFIKAGETVDNYYENGNHKFMNYILSAKEVLSLVRIYNEDKNTEESSLELSDIIKKTSLRYIYMQLNYDSIPSDKKSFYVKTLLTNKFNHNDL